MYYTQEQIIKGCIENNRKFQEILYRQYAPQMYTLCLTFTKIRSQAKDILQDGFLKVFSKIESYQNQGSLEGWIRRIMVNTGIDHIRKYKKEMDWLNLEELEIEHDHIDESMMEDIDVNDLIEQLNQLPEGARIVFNLYVIEGYKHNEIAKKLNISEGTSKSQYSRARTLLKKMLKEQIN